MTGSRTGRLRLVVIQALVFSLFATLLVRLYYLQVVSGEEYHAQAASQSVRDIVVQPQRGLIVDDMGRPLVANRASWVVSVDRTMLARMTERQQDVLVDRVAGVVDVPARTIRAKLLDCGDEGSEPGVCWNGSPYQPIPVARDVRQSVALRILEQPEDYPGVLAEQQSVRAYPRPFGINLAHVLGYLEPDHRGRVRPGPGGRATARSTAPRRSAAPASRSSTTAGCAACRATQSVAVDSMGRVLGDDGEVAGQPGDTLVTSIDAKVQSVVEKQLWQTIQTARQTRDTVTGRNYAADSGAAVVMEARHRPDRRDGQPADVRPERVGRRHHEEAARPALLRGRRQPRCSAGPRRGSSRPARPGSRS